MRGASDAPRASRPVWRRGAALLVGAALVGGAVLGLAAPASAHNYMIASTPAVDGTLTSLPKDFEITTNDKLLDIGGSNSGFAYRIKGPDGRYYDNGCLDVDGPSMTTTASLGASGEYTVLWQIISADGHTVSDEYTFTWKAPAGFTPSKGAKTPPTCATGSTGAASGAASAPSSTSGSGSSDLLWIGGGALVLVLLVVVVLLMLRKPKEPLAGAADDDSDDARD